MAEALSGQRDRGGTGAESATEPQSAANSFRVGGAGGGLAATATGLGSTQAAASTAERRDPAARWHHSSHLVALRSGTRLRSAACGGVTFSTGPGGPGPGEGVLRYPRG